MDNPYDHRSVEKVITDDGRYSLEAFGFLHEGLEEAVKVVHGEEHEHEDSGHVSGQQLCCSLRDLARKRWGMMSRAVLDNWGIRETIDFGNMVYLLIEAGFMRKTEEDDIEDFRDVYDFDDSFDTRNEIRMR